MDNITSQVSRRFNSVLERDMVKQRKASVLNSAHIYKADHLVMVIDGNFGGLACLKELFHEVAFPT